jgi:DNA replication protein DnaC
MEDTGKILLILDALGYVRPKPEYAGLLFDVINACRGRVALIFTSNVSFEEWGQNIGNPCLPTSSPDLRSRRTDTSVAPSSATGWSTLNAATT